MRDWTKGFWAMLAVCVTWGLSPLYYHQLNRVPVLDVLAHRTLWSLVLFTLILGVQGRLAEFAAALRGPMLGRMTFAALMVSANWGLFIWSVQAGHVVQSSLGYYMFPLVAVVMGVALFGERLGLAQTGAVILAAAAVATLTLGLGVTPWISLVLAVTFGLYGAAKKALPIGPLLSVACEVAILSPLAVAWLGARAAGLLPQANGAQGFADSWRIGLLLVASGAVTAVPLILFGYAARRIELATVGLMQYLNPTLQFLCAVFVFHEPVTRWHMIAFGMIWAALAIYTAAAWGQGRAARAARRDPATGCAALANRIKDV